MPGQKKYRKRRYKKRKYKNRKNRYQLALYKQPLGRTFKTTLLYNETHSLNPASGSVTQHVFSCNSLYDPDRTGVGHQPRGFDQLMAFYDHFVVIASRIRVDFVNTDTVNGQKVGISIMDSTLTPTDVRDYVENGNTKILMLGTAGSAKAVQSIVFNVNPNKFLDRTKPLSDPDLKGNISANPSEECFYHVWAIGSIGQDTAIVNMNVMIEYTAVFLEPKHVTIS